MEELPWRIPEGGRPMSYQPLAEPPATIRLFRIVSCGDCSVAGRLQNFEFSEIPEYRALSYMWGLKDKQHPICIDGHSFMVYSNLFTFLQLYKTRRVDEWIWIDQICIDQSNMEERNAQVKLMSEIYWNASEVLIWLNPVLDPTYRPGVKCCRRDNRYHSHSCPWMREMLGNPYWQRLWIVQECQLARRKVMWFGNGINDRLIPYDESLDGWDITILSKQPDARERAHGFRPSLATTIGTWYNQKCENLRDKVYGIQGIISEAERVNVDYAKSVKDVFIDAVTVIMLSYEGLGNNVVHVWNLASSMGVDEWITMDTSQLPDIMALAKVHTETHWRSGASHSSIVARTGPQFKLSQSSLRDALLLLMEKEQAALAAWIQTQRQAAGLPDGAWEILVEDMRKKLAESRNFRQRQIEAWKQDRGAQ